MQDDTGVQFFDNQDKFVRSVSFKRPWSLSSEEIETRYGRQSRAILDANGDVVVILDPSANEYSVACTEEAAKTLIALVNGLGV